jgi:hypothetical protein
MKKIRMEITLSDDQYEAWFSQYSKDKFMQSIYASMASVPAPDSFSEKAINESLKKEIRKAVWSHFQEIKIKEED